MAEPAVIFDGVWKKFQRGERHDSLRDLIPALVRRISGHRSAGELRGQEFWAVQDVSFHVRSGEALGIIGPNGAGKSTVLKLLTRILKATRGHCEVRGRPGALIEVAAGFHPDLTGRENVYLQGAIMGMKHAEIRRKFDEIVAFAGIGDFIDTQVKRYSSGMNARLGFSIAAHLDPDVLIIDEILAVGDAAFQDKCVTRMRELIRRGTPVVFVSHNLPAVLELCTRVIVLDHGVVRFDGDPAAAIQAYRLVPRDRPDTAARAAGPIRLLHADLLNERGEPGVMFHTRGTMRIRIHFEAAERIRSASFAVDIHRADGIFCAGINTMMDRRPDTILPGPGWIDLVLPRLPLLPGCYAVSVGILDAQAGTTYDVQFYGYPFSVVSDRRDLGVVYLDHEWTRVADAAAARPLMTARADRPAMKRDVH